MAITQRRQRSEHLKTQNLRKHKYAQRARRRFCKGTCFIAPVDLILTGKRTLEEWAAMLSDERELEQRRQSLNQTSRTLANKPQL
jgi:hypothetical protein